MKKVIFWHIRNFKRIVKTAKYIGLNAVVILKTPIGTHFTIDYNHGNNRCSRWRYLAHTTAILWKI